mgnify:CR=1 FL=1
MKKYILTFIIGLLIIPSISNAQATSNFWKLISNVLYPALSTWPINVPSTATSTFGGSIAVTEVATSSFAGGINATGGCFAINGTCVGGSGGAGTVTGTGSTNALTYWTSSTDIGATTSPTVGYITATSTTATSSTQDLRINGQLTIGTVVGASTETTISTPLDALGRRYLKILGLNDSGANILFSARGDNGGGGGMVITDGTHINLHSNLYWPSDNTHTIGDIGQRPSLIYSATLQNQGLLFANSDGLITEDAPKLYFDDTNDILYASSTNVNNGNFVSSATTGTTTIGNLETGADTFQTDAGIVNWIDMPIANAFPGLTMSYTAQIGGLDILTISGLATTSNTVIRPSVGIATTSTMALFAIQNNGNSGMASSSQYSFLIASTTAGFATTTQFSVGNNGNVAIGTSTNPLTSLFQLFSTATTTQSIDSNSTSKGGCIEIKDISGVGYTYITAEDGVLFASTISCK